MDDKRFYNEILLEHDRYPAFRHPLPDADIVLDGVNPSCGDEIRLLLKTDGDTIVDGAFVGEGCAVSQASCDIMLGQIVGQDEGAGAGTGRELHAHDPRRSVRGGDRGLGGGRRAA